MNKKYYIVGSGIVGAVVARELAEKGCDVLIFEKRKHTGGNLYDFTDGHGIRIQAYGPHVFHTGNRSVWEYVNRFAVFEPYVLVCGAEIDGKCVPTPFDFRTVDTFFPEEAKTIKARIKNAFPGKTGASVLEMLDSEDLYVRKFALFLFEKDYAPYTEKQWGIRPEKIDKSVLQRVAVRFSYGNGYFDDPYQGIPVNGYAGFIDRLLDHERITVLKNTDALERLNVLDGRVFIDGKQADGTVIYTGPIDALFEFRFGGLPYRSLRFWWRYETTDSFQEYPVVAYPQKEGFTRITEYKKLPVQKAPGTTYAIEYPLPYEQGRSEPFYPVLTEESRTLFEKYRDLASRTDGLICCGRLADYQYYNMDQAVERALTVVRSL